ncbi:MAG: type II toxin-antitoxin system RelE/ParE family toxin [Chloroflexi bacterium]|nr:type II toxin-antitoxin system RelE/ParE family toxin [Chloroflexota bacterium]
MASSDGLRYALKIHRNVEEQLLRIPKKQRERLVATMRSLSEDPRPAGCVKLDELLYRVRQGQYRVIYAVFDDDVVVVVCKVARRAEDTYRDLETLLDRARGVLGQR